MKASMAAGILAATVALPGWALNDGLGGGAPTASMAPSAPVAPAAPMSGGDGAAAALPFESGGKVLSEKTGSGYTYLELENQGHKYWVAGPTTKVKKGDKVTVSPNVVMEGFTSKFMNRTFDRIVFVSAIKIVK